MDSLERCLFLEEPFLAQSFDRTKSRDDTCKLLHHRLLHHPFAISKGVASLSDDFDGLRYEVLQDFERPSEKTADVLSFVSSQ